MWHKVGKRKLTDNVSRGIPMHICTRYVDASAQQANLLARRQSIEFWVVFLTEIRSCHMRKSTPAILGKPAPARQGNRLLPCRCRKHHVRVERTLTAKLHADCMNSAARRTLDVDRTGDGHLSGSEGCIFGMVAHHERLALCRQPIESHLRGQCGHLQHDLFRLRHGRRA